MKSHAAAVVPVLTADEEMDVIKARAAVEQAKKYDFATRMERNRNVNETVENLQQDITIEEEVVQRKRRRWKLWRWLRRSESD